MTYMTIFQTWIHEYTARHWCTQKTNNVNQLICWIHTLSYKTSQAESSETHFIIVLNVSSNFKCSSRWPSFLREAFTAVSCITYSIVRNRSLYVQAWIQKLLGVNQYTEMSECWFKVLFTSVQTYRLVGRGRGWSSI